MSTKANSQQLSANSYKTPPQALDLEAAILGAALLEADAQRTLLALLPTEEVFYSAAHQQVYLAIRDLVQAGDHADLLTVVARLRHRGTLARTGGPHFIAQLTQKINSAAHLDTHCRILQQQHARRVVIRAGTELAAHGYDDSRDPLELLATAQTHLTNLHRSLETKPGQTAAAAFDATFERLAQSVGQHGLTGIPTGLTQLDGLTGGWQPGDLVILAARPAMGKTAALLHFARTAAFDHGHHAAIFSLEMPTLQLMQRMIASEVPGYSNSDLRRGNLPGGLEQVAHIREQAHRLRTHGHLLHLDDTPGLSIQQLRAKCARLHAQQPLSLVLVDYIQLMRGDTKGNREQEVGSISRSLKELAKELNAPVLALSQLSRDVEKRGGEKRPLLSDLRESGSLEQDADCIIFLWRGEYYKIPEYEDGTATADTVLFDIAKHRNGATDEVVAGCTMRRGTFQDLSPGA
ncbi:replicative DNA helicase [Hymenobacter rubripertinctus]|uniref:Replicative DNA helicase n=1 Tax=Hymenobacter rubripertinctus TaxID=2029981 RepID=A0A418R4Z0_9BACT|nr:replicative DNA helicase [Hymenobacter rubripertinctus]RIY12399.1 replicative DNA helicase [Hymenobacter rubripertinctus]